MGLLALYGLLIALALGVSFLVGYALGAQSAREGEPLEPPAPLVAPAPAPVAPELAPKPEPVMSVLVRFFDEHETLCVGERTMDKRARRVNLTFKGARFHASRQLVDGSWIYRRTR